MKVVPRCLVWETKSFLDPISMINHVGNDSIFEISVLIFFFAIVVDLKSF